MPQNLCNRIHIACLVYFPDVGPETCFDLMVLASVRRRSVSGDGVKSAEQTRLEIKRSIQRLMVSFPEALGQICGGRGGTFTM